MSTATLTTARSIVATSLLHPDNSNIGSADIDIAIYSCCSEFLSRARIVEKIDTSLTLTGSVSELDMSGISDFRSENVVRVELMYPDMGTWATGSTYEELHLVQGDGSPDSLFYVCTGSHVSDSTNEPPNTSYWTRSAWKGGFPVEVTDYDAVANLLNSSTGDSYGEYQKVPVDVNRPRKIGFRSQTDAQLFPVPDVAWGVRVIYRPTMPTWTMGGSNDGTIALPIPLEYLHPICQFGAASYVQFNDELTRYGSAGWARFQEYIRTIRGNAGNPGGVVLEEAADLL